MAQGPGLKVHMRGKSEDTGNGQPPFTILPKPTTAQVILPQRHPAGKESGWVSTTSQEAG